MANSININPKLTMKRLLSNIHIGDEVKYFIDHRGGARNDSNVMKVDLKEYTVIAIEPKPYETTFRLKSGEGTTENIKIYLSDHKILIISRLTKRSNWGDNDSILFQYDIRDVKEKDDSPALWSPFRNSFLYIPCTGWVNFYDDMC